MESGRQAIAENRCQVFPVFRGLADAKIPGKEIAEIVGVAPPTYSKWRTGRAKIPAATLVFLTLLLANKIEELLEKAGGEEMCKTPRFEVSLKSIHRYLRLQETFNCNLHPAAIREGARLFQRWWRLTTGELIEEEAGSQARHDPFWALSERAIYQAQRAENIVQGAQISELADAAS